MPENRGGPRTGTPGTSYTNRVDLTGNYGDKVALERQQQAVPIPTAPSAPSAPSAPAPMAPQRPTPPGAFNRPTERPDEPVTSGLDSGPGSGSEAIGQTPVSVAALLDQLGGSSSAVAQLAAYVRGGRL